MGEHGQLRVEIGQRAQDIERSPFGQCDMEIIAVFYRIENFILVDIEGVPLSAQFYGGDRFRFQALRVIQHLVQFLYLDRFAQIENLLLELAAENVVVGGFGDVLRHFGERRFDDSGVVDGGDT